MSHEIDTTTGEAAFLEAGERVTAWHKLGRTISLDELKKLSGVEKIRRILKLGKLAWDVEPQDVFNKDGKLIQGWKSFERSDTHKTFGVFRESYQIVQNEELLELVLPMIDAGIMEFETGGAIHGGADVWFLMKFNPQVGAVKDYFAEQGITPYGLLANNHSYQRLLTIQETMIRVVCKNTLSAATGMFGKKRQAGRYPGAILLRHTRNVRSLSVDAVNDLWGEITARFQGVVDGYQAMKARRLTKEEFSQAVLDLISPLPTDPASKQFASTMDRALDRRNFLTKLYKGAGAGIDGKPTAWNAYQATAEALDHNTELFPTRGLRLEAIYPNGSLANRKQDVLNALYALSVTV